MQTQEFLVSQIVRGYWTPFVMIEVVCVHSLNLSINGSSFFNLENNIHKNLKIILLFKLFTE